MYIVPNVDARVVELIVRQRRLNGNWISKLLQARDEAMRAWMETGWKRR